MAQWHHMIVGWQEKNRDIRGDWAWQPEQDGIMSAVKWPPSRAKSLRTTYRVGDVCLVVWASWFSVHCDWYDLCASGSVLTLSGLADLCRVLGSTATVEYIWDWPCGSHASPQHNQQQTTAERKSHVRITNQGWSLLSPSTISLAQTASLLWTRDV